MVAEKIKILRVMTRLNIGGPSRHVKLLMEGLDENKFEQKLVVGVIPPGEEELASCVPHIDARIPSLHRAVSPLRDYLARRQLAQIIAEYRPDIVHTHQAKAGFLARSLAARFSFCRFVHTFHGHTFSGYWRWPMQSWVRWAERRAAAQSSALIVQSPSQEREIGEVLGPSAGDKMILVPPAIDLTKLSLAPSSPSQLRSELGLTCQRVLVFLGRLTEVKNPSSFLRVLGHVKEMSKENVVALMVGGGADEFEEGLHDQVDELNLRSWVRWLGYRGDIASILGLADVCVSTSINEGTPLSLIEALYCGAQVAAFDVGGIRDTIGEFPGCQLVKSGAEMTLAKGIVAQLETGPPSSNHLRQTREILHRRFGEERLVGDLESLYLG